MSLLVQDFINRFERFAPQYLAEPGDPTGMQLGSTKQPIHRVMVTLDVRPEVVQEAIEQRVDFIFAHHPVVFHPVQNLITDNPQNAMYAELLAHHIAVYAAHTNLDSANGGMNDWLAERLHLQQVSLLQPSYQRKMKKLAVFVPQKQATILRQALVQAGAGQIGNYHGASYSLAGTGRFTPEQGAQPAIGHVGQEETVAEEKIEVIFPETLTQQVLAAMYRVHPYEEPAYDLYTLDNPGEQFGIGRIGELAQPMTVQAYAQQVRQAFDLTGLRLVTPDPAKLIKRVAVIGGDGGKFYPAVLKQQADVFVTGDVYYHTAHDMLAAGLSVIDPGHHIESIVKEKAVPLFQGWAKEEKWADVSFFASKLNTDPFRFISM
ncbi:Nif3-like dinuclear metal center hexameric protein [Loigolactobacillus backii]|uniref:Nif3-like dinuclear metal center hexameric protein n=1 Tax=Loigolactobacillus backii TaxID=375175 RepID=UPI0007F117E3|nr:Nif3-like dinuclear metal center hexameric protein [Loigolactobacillus backii]ANK59589.1 Nif3-like dinuclear metal center hexameric protein [Loigolactobacillus backii]ANK64583.1 Nif3-like dinuclear metal center hexameric protein [Loigolactobacillus backii]ANK67022.1 Nif3-like dinuclear metal center hexameric protein [Loigolactobacillus backii]OLF70732.1 NGG1p interacting factor 3 protein, NIF3 [Loigolactobacillus backii]PIO87666.1 Nif3-like dinuclear metal center hexameric protein [Loigolac